MNKQILIDALREIATLESDRFKSRAYLNSVMVLTNMSDEEFDNRKSFLNIPGIGMSINTKIMDFKLKGELPAKLFKLREENKSYLDPALYKIRKGFVTKRITYEEATNLVIKLRATINSNGLESVNLGFLGSYRREKKFIADLDLLVVGEKDYIKIVELMKKQSWLSLNVAGPMKCTFVFDNPEKTTLDISWCSEACLPFSVLHFTGSAASNIRLRAKAQKMGLKLNQYGFEIIDRHDPRTDEAEEQLNASVKSERDIFKILKEPYVEPKDR